MDAVGRWSLRTVAAEALSLGVVVAVVCLALPGLWGAPGAPMEEGFMLVFPELVAEGAVPHVDFLHLYGPGSLWVLAGAYRLFGATLEVERSVGAAQILVASVAVWGIGRCRGRVLAAVAGSLTAVVLLPLGLVALAWVGGLAAGLAALALLAVADLLARRPSRRRAPAVAVVDALAGVAAAVAVLYRPDLVLAVGAALAWWVWQLPGRRRTVLLAAGAVTSSAWLVHLWRSGPAEAFRGMVLEPVLELRPGRSLPVPPSWGEVDAFLQRAGTLGRTPWPLTPPESVQIHLWFWLVLGSVGVAIVGAGLLRRRAPSSWAARVLVPFAAFAALLLPQALQRPDVTHLSWVSAVTFPAAMLVVGELLREVRPGWDQRLIRTASAVLVVGVVVLVAPSFPLRGWVDAVAAGRPGTPDRGHPVVRGERWFPYGSAADAAAAQEIVDELTRSSSPGERLVVGPADLSRTVYSDAWLYSLFDELVPGTRFIEMDPGLADDASSGLAEEVRSADWVVLSEVWADWDEPNESRRRGSTAADDALADSFCEVLDNGRFRLLRRCDEAAGRPGPGGATN